MVYPRSNKRELVRNGASVNLLAAECKPEVMYLCRLRDRFIIPLRHIYELRLLAYILLYIATVAGEYGKEDLFARPHFRFLKTGARTSTEGQAQVYKSA